MNWLKMLFGSRDIPYKYVFSWKANRIEEICYHPKSASRSDIQEDFHKWKMHIIGRYGLWGIKDLTFYFEELKDES